MGYSISFRLKSYLRWAFNFFIGYANVKTLIRIIAAYRLYKKADGPKYKSTEADTIIWIHYPTYKIFRTNIVWDILLVAYVASCKQKFKIHRGIDIGKYRDKTILFNLNKDRINLFRLENYSSIYWLLCGQLEEQNNNVYPTHHDIMYWENKVYMYGQFKKLGISTPKTTFYTDFNTLIDQESSFPFLIKIPNSSGSYGLFNVTDKQYLQQLINDPIITANKYYIVQERLNITMDMRVIIVGDEIVHSYWRKNKDKTKWKTTSTSSGSKVEFVPFPKQWEEHLMTAFKKLNLITGAFDVGWQNDDLTTEPYYFEVSPSYDINPSTTNEAHLLNYGKYKNQLLLKDSFDRLFVEQTYHIKQKAVAQFFERLKEQQK